MYDAVQAAINAGLDPNLAAYMPRYVQIESGGNPNAQTGSYSGLLQMGPDEQARYGGNGLNNGAAMYATNAKWFSDKFGRKPTPTELYMVAQQGQGGIANHLANPDTPAWQNMYATAEGQQKGPAWARRAIWGNVPKDVRAQFPGGVDNLTSQQFLDLWQHKVERTPMSTAFASSRKANMDPMQAALAAQQYSYDPSYDPNAGLFDRLKAGGPGALFGAPKGVFPGANGRSGYDLGNRLQRAAAWAMSLDTKGGSLGALRGLEDDDRKFVQVGTDEWGNPRYGFVDTKRGTVTPVGGAPGAAGVGGSSAQGGDAISAAVASGKTGEELLSQPGIPPGVASIVRGISEGAQPFNPGTLMRTPQGRMALALLDRFEPGTTPADYAGRASGMKDWGGGKSNETTRRAGQAIRHGASTAEVFDEMGNTQFPAVNAVKNFFTEQLGGGAPTAARQGVTALANEMGAFVRGNGGSDAAFEEWAKGFPINGSPEQQRRAMGMLGTLFKESMGELEQKRLRAIGPVQSQKLGPLMSPDAQRALKKLEEYSSGGTLAPGVTSIKQIN